MLVQRVPSDLGAQSACAGPVDRPVDDDAVQPRAERTPAVEAVEGADRPRERFLSAVLRCRSVLDDAICGAVRAGPVLAKERIEIRDRSGLGAPHPSGFATPEPRHRARTIRT